MGGGGVVENLLDGAGFDDAAIGDEGDVVGDLAGKTHFVGDQDKIASLLAEFLNDVEHFGGHFRIERGSGFVKQQEFGLDGDGAGDGDALTLAAGQFGGAFRGVIFEAETGEKLAGDFGGIGGRMLMHLFQRQGDVFQRGEMREKIEGLEDRADGTAVAEERFLLENDALAVDFLSWPASGYSRPAMMRS